MELKLQRKTLNIDIYGQNFKVNVPSMARLAEYRQRLDGIGDAEVFDAMREFVESLGIPKDVALDMDADDFLTLVNFICNPKKK